MNYANFYTSAKEMLVDSLVSMWFRGNAEEKNYMRKILTEEEPLLSEPVFQSIFPWEESKETFGEHASRLNILSSEFVNALSSSTIDKDLRFPLDRHPYKHQTESWKTMLSDRGKTIVVTSGTGSGKTECFMIPVLQDIANRNERDCVQAIFLYPLNALMKSQQERINAWCNAMPKKITYAIYNGDTENTEKQKDKTSSYPQLISRDQIRQTPPQILFTNPTMLNYMLVRYEDKEILQKSRGKLKWILLDEAHTYTGSSAAELSLQLRRVLDAFGVTINQVNFAVTSATIGDETNPKTELRLKTFVSQLTGKPIDDITVIGGKRIIPEIDIEKASNAINEINQKYGINLSIDKIQKLRNELNSKSVLSTKQIAQKIDNTLSNDIVKSLKIIDALADKTDGLNEKDGPFTALLPSRIHYFVRSISGVYVCVNPKCSKHQEFRIGIGSLTTYQNTNCPICKSKMLEIATCPSCGGTIVVGEDSTDKGYRMRTSNTVDIDENIFQDTNEDLIESEEQTENQKSNRTKVDDFTPFYFAMPKSLCLRRHATEVGHTFNLERNKIETANNNDTTVYKSLRNDNNADSLCPHCGNKITRLNYLRSSATMMGRFLSSLILDNAEKGENSIDADILYEGKKYITFTDSRQGAARFAMGLNQDVERAWIRSSIFHKLADIRIDKTKPNNLIEEEKKEYDELKSWKKEKGTLCDHFEKRLAEFEGRISGNQTTPDSPEVEWDEILKLKDNSDLQKLCKHLGQNRYNVYLKALLYDQFGWIPKRANSLENMGIVRLVYPGLRNAKCPISLQEIGCEDNDWQIFLKICLDYVIRGGRHYKISGDCEDLITQIRYTTYIYPQNTNLKGDKKTETWPIVKVNMSGKVQEYQSRLVLLLCAVLGYNEVDEFDREKIAKINGILKDAWDFITSKILTCEDNEHHGYMLDLQGSKVKLQLLDKGYLCPVDNIIVDVNFHGYSPRINGYISKTNFDRFKISTEFNYAFYPFKSTEASEKEIRQWISVNFEEQKSKGAFSDIHERIYIQKPIFIAAEHSAQQDNKDLDRYEKEFIEGHINILSCSTTMEMGVDIKGISEVVMNDVPPKAANYLQRAGRAGRRKESKALALTFCAPNPVGTYTWENPDYPITHITETPLLKLESHQLIQRNVNALIFADFVTGQQNIRITSNIKDFFESENEVSFYNQFLNHIDTIIGGQEASLSESYSNLVKGSAFCDKSLYDAAVSTKKDISAVYDTYKIHLDSLSKSIEELSDRTQIAIENKRKNFLKTNLLKYLAENSFLPSAGLPTGLVTLELTSKENSKERGNNQGPTMHLSQAISSYAPGNKIVKDEWIYEPAGILTKTKYDAHISKYILQRCTKCGYTSIIYGNAIQDCPMCKEQNSMGGIKDMSAIPEQQRFTEVVEPAAFSVGWESKRNRNMGFHNSMKFIQPVLLEMGPWPDNTSSAKMNIRLSSPKSEILFYNRGYGYGYAFCPYCGRMEAENISDETKGIKIMTNHRCLSTGKTCEGGKKGGIRRHVLLVGRYQTDFVEIKFYKDDNTIESDSETLYSLGVILSRSLTALLGINDGEIDFGYNSAGHSIFIYDTALGGAGYSPLLREYKDKILKNAYDILKKCDCERACTKCLIDRRSQWYLNYLNRKKALDWLELEIKSRVAPERITRSIPDATFITSDFASEFYQLLRNKDIKFLAFHVDNNYSEWEPDEFPYTKHINELSIIGLDIAFILNKNIDIKNCSSSIRTILMAALIQYKFSIGQCGLPDFLHPLLSVTFNDGTTKTYFGENIDTSFSSSWGNGDIFCTPTNQLKSCSYIDYKQVFRTMTEGDGNIMFDTYIKKDCDFNTFFELLSEEESDKWAKISEGLKKKKVSIEYSDRYLLTPLGCLLLAHILASIKSKFNIIINSIKISTTKKDIDNNTISNEAVKLGEDYQNSEARDKFLSNAIFNLVNIKPEINDNCYINHERCLTLNSETSVLCIRPDAGIAHGWKPFGRRNTELTDKDFEQEWTKNMNLFNQKKNNSVPGIFYTISYKKN